jgi:hypothetical protein
MLALLSIFFGIALISAGVSMFGQSLFVGGAVVILSLWLVLRGGAPSLRGFRSWAAPPSWQYRKSYLKTS